MSYRVQVITVSDKGSRGERVDTSGPAIRNILEKDFTVGDIIIVPDEADIIADAMKRAIDEDGMDMVVSPGGTGLSARAVTPAAPRSVIERDLPRLAEVMRAESYRITPRAIISRAVCGIRHKSIIINLPGSEKAAVECLGFVIGAIPHALAKLKGDASDCAV